MNILSSLTIEQLILLSIICGSGFIIITFLFWSLLLESKKTENNSQIIAEMANDIGQSYVNHISQNYSNNGSGCDSGSSGGGDCGG